MPVNPHLLDEAVVHRIGPSKPPEGPPPSPVSDAAIEILQRVIRRSGKIVLVAAVLGGVLAFGIASMSAPLYDGVATLIVIRPRTAPETARPAPVSTFRALLETNVLATSAIAQFHLDQPPYRMTEETFMSNVLNLEEVRNTSLIRIHARLRDPKVAAALADFVATRAIALNDEINRQQTTDFRGQLKGMLDDATARMKEGERLLLEFRTSAHVDVTKKDADAALDQRGQLLALTVDIEAEKARLARAEVEIKSQQPYLAAPRQVEAEAALRNVDPSGSETTGVPRKAGLDAGKQRREPSDALKQVREQGDADNQGLDLSNAFANPVYQVLQYQISLSRTRLSSLEARRRQMVGVQGLGGRELTSLGSLYPKEIQLRRLETEYELTKTVYSEVALEYERARLQSAGTTAKLQLIDHAVPPVKPQPRYRSLIALAGMIAAGAGAVLLAAAVELARR
jgi:uncharacterized protein involved in exopolysaccharide biosynthesis